LSQNIVFDGHIQIPVLTLHTTADGLVPVEHEQAYASVVRAARQNQLLRQSYIHRAGHCNFTPAEEIGALQAIIQRLDMGKWKNSTHPHILNQAAEALGGGLNTSPPAFVTFTPGPFLRPFDLRSGISPDSLSDIPLVGQPSDLTTEDSLLDK
jgi:hypothetical protein